jgi:hypothetical protein
MGLRTPGNPRSKASGGSPTPALGRAVGDVDERVLADPREDADRREAGRLEQR